MSGRCVIRLIKQRAAMVVMLVAALVFVPMLFSPVGAAAQEQSAPPNNQAAPPGQQNPPPEDQGVPQEQQEAPPVDQSGAPVDQAPYAKLSKDQLNRLVAPIALYPDALVAQVLTASTFPSEIVDAQNWLKAHPGLSTDDLANQVNSQTWDPSVKALTEYPSVLSNLASNLGWTSELGDAYYNQPEDVQKAVQEMRKKAQKSGNLHSTPQEDVQDQDGNVTIQPANPQVVYVPQYDPWAVYGYPIAPWPYWVDVPGVWWGGPGLYFGFGFPIAPFLGFGWGWGGWGMGWHHWGGPFYHGGPYYLHGPAFFDRGRYYGGHPGFARPGPYRGFMGPRGNFRGFQSPQNNNGLRSGPFTGAGRGGGMTRGFSARGQSSFGGGFHGGGFAGGGFHGGGGHGGGGRH